MTATETETQIKLHTKKFALQALLSRAAAVVPSRDVLPVLKNFLIEADKGKVTVAATDMELTVIATTELVDVETPGVAVFPARQLLDIVKEADDGELELTVSGKFASVTVGRTSWNLSLPDGSTYPSLPPLADITFHPIDRAKLLRAIKAVRYAASTTTYRTDLMVLNLSNHRLQAADGLRFQQMELGQTFPLSIHIPIGAVADLVKTLETTDTGEVEIGATEDFLCFRVSEQVFVTRTLNMPFPDMDEMLLKPALLNNEELYVDRQEFIRAIRKVRITADPETSSVQLELSTSPTGGSMEISSKDKKGSTARTTLDVSWDGPNEKILTVNHAQLLDMLTMAESPNCHFFLGQGKKNRPAPLLLKDEEAGSVGVLNQVLAGFLK